MGNFDGCMGLIGFVFYVDKCTGWVLMVRISCWSTGKCDVVDALMKSIIWVFVYLKIVFEKCSNIILGFLLLIKVVW